MRFPRHIPLRHFLAFIALVAGAGCASRHHVKSNRRNVQSWLDAKVSLEEAEKEIASWRPREDFLARWKNFLAQLQEGDELWSYGSKSGRVLADEGGYAIVRAGQVIAWFRVWLS